MSPADSSRQATRYAVVFLVLAVSLLLLYRLREVFTPIFLAFIVAYLLDPLIDRLESRRINRTLAIVIFLGGLILVALPLGVFLLPHIQEELVSLFGKVPIYLSAVQNRLVPWVEKTFRIDAGEAVSHLADKLKTAATGAAPDVYQPITNFIGRAFSNTYNLLMAALNAVMIPLFAFYFLRDFDRIKERIFDMIPRRHKDYFEKKFTEVDRVLGAFVRGQLLVCGLLGAVYSLGLLLVGLDLAVVIGVTAGLANLIPYLGFVVGFSSASLVALLQFGDQHLLAHLLAVAGVFGVGQLLEGTLLTPLIVGDRVGLHPVVIIVALLVAGNLFGFLGILLAVPATAAFKVFFDSLIAHYRESEFYNRGS